MPPPTPLSDTADETSPIRLLPFDAAATDVSSAESADTDADAEVVIGTGAGGVTDVAVGIFNWDATASTAMLTSRPIAVAVP